MFSPRCPLSVVGIIGVLSQLDRAASAADPPFFIVRIGLVARRIQKIAKTRTRARRDAGEVCRLARMGEISRGHSSQMCFPYRCWRLDFGILLQDGPVRPSIAAAFSDGLKALRTVPEL